jgi:hydroxymethylpyrimidine pyrophosphatase-like HAD family hydrolase
MKHIPRGWLLDVDGTVTNPRTKQLGELSILSSLTALLASGDVVGFNTGRSPAWVIERVIIPFRKFMGEERWDSFSPRITVVGGKGTVWVERWKRNGEFEEGEDRSLVLPNDFRMAIKKLTEGYSHSMFFDETKTIIVTAEMLDGYDVQEFAKDQKELVLRLKNLVTEYAMEDTVRIDPMRISVDIEPLHAGKGLGASQTIRILKERGFVVDEWIVMGDSPSDYAAPEYLADHSIPVRFVYVGDMSDLDGKTPSFPIEETVKSCDEATAEYLMKMLQK